METATDRARTALIALSRSIVPGQRWPDWAVASPSGHLIGLIIEIPLGGPIRRLTTAVRAQTMTAWVQAGWVMLGEEEPVPEYEGRRPGLRWDAGRSGRRLVLTPAGREVARWWPVES